MSAYTGGCLCGKVRYTVNAEPTFPHLCSCRQCQKWSGAPVVAWVDFPLEGFRFESEPKFFRSSEKTQRASCSECGSALCALDDDGSMISLTLATLDEPNTIVPESHSFADLAPSWLRFKP